MIRRTCGLLSCLALLAATSCQPVIFAKSDSPDGKYRCEVIRVRSKLSELLDDGKFLYYDFDIRDVNTRNSLPGGSFEYGDGKIQLDDKKLEFKWTENQLTVIDHRFSPANEFLIASFDSAGQHWKQTN